MTLTFAGIARARLVLVTVAGADKREALARVAAGDRPCRPPTSTPSGWSGWPIPAAAGDLPDD